MQQTQKYKLNLIESSDPFSPEGLNANTQKIEDVLMEKMEGPMVGLDQRVTALEGHRLAVGFFSGSMDRQFIEVGFRPKVVLVHDKDKLNSALGVDIPQCATGSIIIEDTGFWFSTVTASVYFAFA